MRNLNEECLLQFLQKPEYPLEVRVLDGGAGEASSATQSPAEKRANLLSFPRSKWEPLPKL